jgi:outer membrane autotransporter protein
MTTGQAAALQGNCTVNGVAATAGTEQWTFPAAAGPVVNGTAATSATRAVGAAPLQVAFANAGNFTPSLTFSFNGVTSAAINAPITVTPPPAVACAPTVSPTPALSGQAFTINGNCTVNGVAATTGTETWSIPAIAGQAAATVTRVLPAAALQRTIAAPGAYSFGLQFTSAAGTSPAYNVAVNIAQNPATAVPDPKSVTQVAEAVRANTMASMAGIRAQLGNVQSRIRTIRQGGTAGWVNDTTVQINGRNIPVPGAGGGASSGSKEGGGQSGGQSGSSSAGAPARSEEFDATQSRAWGAYIMGTVSVEELKGSNGFEVGTNGLTAGADYRFSKQMVVGGAAGYSKSASDLSGLTDAQRASGTSLTFYGSFEPMPRWYIDAAVSAARNNFKLKRIATTGNLANASTKGSGTGLSITSGYQFLREAIVLSPYVRVDALRVNINGFTESGDSPLSVGDQGLRSTVITLGGEAQYIIPTGGAIVIPHARLEMQRQTQNSVRAVTAQLVGSTVQVVVDPQLETDKSFGFFSLGVSAQFKRGLSAFADYEQLFGKSSFSERRVNVGVKLEF